MLCPKFTIFSALFWLSFIQIMIFITELSIGGVQETSFLAANIQTLEDMGQKVSQKSIAFESVVFTALCALFCVGSLSNALQFPNLPLLVPRLLAR